MENLKDGEKAGGKHGSRDCDSLDDSDTHGHRDVTSRGRSESVVTVSFS